MKLTHPLRLALALVPLCLAALPQPAPAQAAPAQQPSIILPPGVPPLTAAEKQKQQARLARFYQDLNALQRDSQLSPTKKQQKFAALKKSLDQDMLALLTPAQRKGVVRQNHSVIKLRQVFLKQHQSEIAQANTLNAAFKKSFTPAQKQKIKTIEAQAQEQMQRLQADTKTPAQAKQHTLDAIVRDMRSQEMGVLTPAQQSQMKQIHAIQIRLGQELTAYAKAHGQQ